ncbi:MAG: hypothetical protein K6A65_08810 [Succinivibrionaceae bacterium]|nr:hypothetical protein [Succinivibrionaceae bacterium]
MLLLYLQSGLGEELAWGQGVDLALTLQDLGSGCQVLLGPRLVSDLNAQGGQLPRPARRLLQLRLYGIPSYAPEPVTALPFVRALAARELAQLLAGSRCLCL